ncbi:MAG: BON domain-containing protein [Chromatiales bacterium]|jgi:osmotically-inducible protein OsmY
MTNAKALTRGNRLTGVTAALLGLLVIAWAGQARALSMEEAKEGATDTWIQAQLTTTYALNKHLSPFTVDVDVDDGVVTLQGTVESEVERELAAEIARGANGVREVVNQLTVAPTGDSREESQLRRFVDDAEISAKIRARIVWSKSMSLLDVDVSTKDKVVSLSGTVPGEAERELLGRIAANTDGVEAVHNELEIADEESLAARAKRETAEAVDAAGRAVSNGWITAKVSASLALDKSVNARDISVETSDGVVTLSGSVASAEEAESALDIASSIEGVKRVDATLSIAE